MNIPEPVTAAHHSAPRIVEYDFNQGRFVCVFRGRPPIEGQKVLLFDGFYSAWAFVAEEAYRNWDNTCWLAKVACDLSTWYGPDETTDARTGEGK